MPDSKQTAPAYTNVSVEVVSKSGAILYRYEIGEKGVSFFRQVDDSDTRELNVYITHEQMAALLNLHGAAGRAELELVLRPKAWPGDPKELVELLKVSDTRFWNVGESEG